MAEVVSLKAVSKKFSLYASRVAQAAAAFGLGRVVPLRSFRPIGTKLALADINISIEEGERVGIIGRNGSGKTTLLRVVLGDLEASSGVVSGSDNIQAMMQTGFGFSDDLTGRQNIENSLHYNGLSGEAREQAIQDVVQFVELGEFLDHPLSTYSLGMRARLEFATATAIRPEVLVIDEVLGAGDGYFANKCAERMRHLTSNTTLILVSHSMHQILEYCDRVIWMDQGHVLMDGPVASVIKSYESFMEQQQALSGENAVAKEDMRDSHRSVKLRSVSRSIVADAGLTFKNEKEVGFSLKIEKFGFYGDWSQEKSGQVGEFLGINVAVSFSEIVQVDLTPLLLGFNEHGKLLFKGKISESIKIDSSTSNLTFKARAFGLGVGKYFIALAILDAETSSVLCVSEDVLQYVVTETNHSDPPRLHLSGNWVADGLDAVQPARISAWV